MPFVRLLAVEAPVELPLTRRTSDNCESSWVMGSIGSRRETPPLPPALVEDVEEEAPGLRNCERRLRLFSPLGWCLERILTM